MSRIVLLGLLASLSLAVACGDRPSPGASAPAAATTVGAPVEPEQLASVLAASDAPLLLDVRTPEEYASGHVPGARLLPVQELESRMGELDAWKDRGVVTYCERGGRASKAAEMLARAGFHHVRVLDGSMSRWRDEGRPMDKGE